ncbi:hypothetical protein [[Mycobacterium] wendilense]|uniref:Uncharacterized protein n=1 Tax=[Mycobacterium] wendilense TaxID=3064284 RepID=A0ABM9MEY5_9MYCO|nr:hypothetical protein [Mycolicibacterium sp. MU0050]CAJ1583553.1 hypothetical protein MU0050_002679 [Mycolicibacterium sp. MU0050]
MCQYGGCRDIPLLRDDIAGHMPVFHHGGSASRALGDGDRPKARAQLAATPAKLRAHWLGEQTGLFDGDDWDTAIAAGHRAHPGRSMIAEGQ